MQPKPDPDLELEVELVLSRYNLRRSSGQCPLEFFNIDSNPVSFPAECYSMEKTETKWTFTPRFLSLDLVPFFSKPTQHATLGPGETL